MQRKTAAAAAAAAGIPRELVNLGVTSTTSDLWGLAGGDFLSTPRASRSRENIAPLKTSQKLDKIETSARQSQVESDTKKRKVQHTGHESSTVRKSKVLTFTSCHG